jgi:hypothetical protein
MVKIEFRAQTPGIIPKVRYGEFMSAYPFQTTTVAIDANGW